MFSVNGFYWSESGFVLSALPAEMIDQVKVKARVRVRVKARVRVRVRVRARVRVRVRVRVKAKAKVKVKVTLRPTISQPVRLGVRRPSGTRDQFIYLLDIFLKTVTV
jgi:hypothetical protein